MPDCMIKQIKKLGKSQSKLALQTASIFLIAIKKNLTLIMQNWMRMTVWLTLSLNLLMNYWLNYLEFCLNLTLLNVTQCKPVTTELDMAAAATATATANANANLLMPAMAEEIT